MPPALIPAYARVKWACAAANLELGYLDEAVAQALMQACDEVVTGQHDDAFPLDALQGGAGTSTNMNVNEVVANRAEEILGGTRGTYERVDPLSHVNLHQSTNDTYPTALRVAAIEALRRLSPAVAELQGALQRREQAFADVVTIGRTELVEAVPMTLGMVFGAMAEALSRDRWRTFKCEERLRVVNLGGTAVGTGLTAPRSYIFLVIDKLREITGLGLCRGENLAGETANADAFVEVSGILKALAVNVEKLGGDLRLLQSTEEIVLPALQAGSSVMPGKVNPVACECAIQAGMLVRANDALVADCAARGSLQIVEFMPLLAAALLESIDVMTRSVQMLASVVDRIESNTPACRARFDRCRMIVTALVPVLGYERCRELLADFDAAEGDDVRAFLAERVGADVVERALAPQTLVALGHREEEPKTEG